MEIRKCSETNEYLFSNKFKVVSIFVNLHLCEKSEDTLLYFSNSSDFFLFKKNFFLDSKWYVEFRTGLAACSLVPTGHMQGSITP